MQLKEIKNQDYWDSQIGSEKMSQFLQSWSWGDFQRSLARKIWYLDLGDNQFALVIKMLLPLNKSYLYVPRTQVNWNSQKIKIIKQLANNEKCIFIRIEPIKQSLLELGFKKVKAVQPQKTLLLDLNKSADDLLMEMHQKTRYNIRLADKKGVQIEECNEEQFSRFYDLIVSTFHRKKKTHFQRDYYNKLFHNKLTKVYYAEYQGNILAANLMVNYGDTVTYLHGGSAENYKNLMAPHLLQWQLIKMAQKQGFKYYDFWGIDEKLWPGVTRFKKGFGGFEVSYPGSFDLPISRLWYLAYKIIKKFK